MRIVARTVYALFLALDLLASALTGGAPLQTLSARFAKARAEGMVIGRIAANVVDWGAWKLFGAKNHCDGALAAYEARVRAAPSWTG